MNTAITNALPSYSPLQASPPCLKRAQSEIDSILARLDFGKLDDPEAPTATVDIDEEQKQYTSTPVTLTKTYGNAFHYSGSTNLPLRGSKQAALQRHNFSWRTFAFDITLFAVVFYVLLPFRVVAFLFNLAFRKRRFKAHAVSAVTNHQASNPVLKKPVVAMNSVNLSLLARFGFMVWFVMTVVLATMQFTGFVNF